MPVELAQQWADKGSLESMSRRLRETEVWLAEFEDQIVGWVAVRGSDYLDGLYVAPDCTKRGIGSSLLKRVEDELRTRGVCSIRVDASWNSEAFYVRRGYESLSPRLPDDARPMRKSLIDSTG